MSKIFLMKGDIEKALEFVNKEVKNNPDVESGYLLLGEIYIKKNELSESLKAFKKAQEINQGSIEALIGLASVQFYMNNLETALDLYLKAANAAPANATVRRQLGVIYKALGQGSLAIESFNTYLELAPDAADKASIESMISTLK
jgi:tetratricopeptide (TPR) repeat protein